MNKKPLCLAVAGLLVGGLSAYAFVLFRMDNGQSNKNPASFADPRPHKRFVSAGTSDSGESNLDKRIAFRMSLEDSIAETIKGLRGVSAVEVNVGQPENTADTADPLPMIASISLTLDSFSAVDSKAIESIVETICDTVRDLTPENIFIMNQNEDRLWPPDENCNDRKPAPARDAQIADKLVMECMKEITCVEIDRHSLKTRQSVVLKLGPGWDAGGIAVGNPGRVFFSVTPPGQPPRIIRYDISSGERREFTLPSGMKGSIYGLSVSADENQIAFLHHSDRIGVFEISSNAVVKNVSLSDFKIDLGGFPVSRQNMELHSVRWIDIHSLLVGVRHTRWRVDERGRRQYTNDDISNYIAEANIFQNKMEILTEGNLPTSVDSGGIFYFVKRGTIEELFQPAKPDILYAYNMATRGVRERFVFSTSYIWSMDLSADRRRLFYMPTGCRLNFIDMATMKDLTITRLLRAGCLIPEQSCRPFLTTVD